MARVGTIIAREGELAVIKTSKRGICDGCAEQESCATDGAVDKKVAEKVLARNGLGAGVGDLVEFELPGHTELKISLLVWIVPLIGVLTGAIVGSELHSQLGLNQDIATLLGLLLGGGLAFGVVMLVDKAARDDTKLVPEVKKVLPSAPLVKIDHPSSH